MTEEILAWFAGIDRGSERHQACVCVSACKKDPPGGVIGVQKGPL